MCFKQKFIIRAQIEIHYFLLNNNYFKTQKMFAILYELSLDLRSDLTIFLNSNLLSPDMRVDSKYVPSIDLQ